MILSSNPTRSVARRGSTAGGLLVVLSVIGALTATTLVVAPRYITAGPAATPPPALEPRTAHRRDLIRALSGLIAGSVGVVAIHDRGSTPFAEVVLWVTDDENRGRLDEGELAILSHSRILRTVSLYRIARDAEEAGLIPLDGGVSEVAFCDRFRADPRVEPLILMTDVSEMQVERIAGGPADVLRLGVTLTWSEESVDGADKASVVISADQGSIAVPR